MTDNIRNSNLYKQIMKPDYIFRAIYSLESYVFEKELLSDDDYKLMLQLRDPFNHGIIETTIKAVQNQLDEVLLNGKFLEAQVYFRPKKINEKDEIESRPLHSSSIVTLIASVVLLNTLLIEISEDGKTIELTELARMLPENFYGNIPSEKPEHLFKPWQYQFKKYTEIITQSYYEYTNTKEYKYEVTLDLKNFFPSINPCIIYEEIISNYAVKYNNDLDYACLKVIVTKLLLFRITNLSTESYKKMYYGKVDLNSLNGDVWSRGIPQGLPHAYFFGNICMVRVAEIFKKVFPGKSYFYVDDSVVYTNALDSEDDLSTKIDEVNDKLRELSNNYREKLNEYEIESKNTSIEPFIKIIESFNYLIEVHSSDSEKSSAVFIQNPKYGQANLNSYSKLASTTSYDMNKLFSDIEEINLSKKLEAIYHAVEDEIERIRTIDSKEDTSNYIKVLLRFKKFFKYRQKCLEYRSKNVISDRDVEDLIKKFNIKKGDSEKDKLGHFFKAYDEDILLNEFWFYFANVPEFWERIEGAINQFDQYIYGDKYKDVSYFMKVSTSLVNKKSAWLNNNVTKYSSIQNIIKKNMWNVAKSSKDIKETEIKNSIDFFVKAFTDTESLNRLEQGGNNLSKILKESGLESDKDSIYSLICIQTDELYRILLNAYFSELISVEANDLKYLAKRNNKPIYYNEARLLLFLRNSKFALENFYLKFRDYKNAEVLDYTLFEVVDYFEKFVQDPVYIDNLILIHKYTSEIWKNGSKYLHFYTLHNQEHAIELVKSIVMFTKSVNYFQISKRDYYILFISCYLHDISMVLHPNLYDDFIKDTKESNLIYSDFKGKISEVLKVDENSNLYFNIIDYVDEQSMKKLLVDFFVKLDQYYEGHVRNNHPKQSARFIRKSNDFNFVEDVVKDIVAEVSQAHGYDVEEIYKIKSHAKDSVVSEKYLKILLRIGDLLDMSSNRISNTILDNNQKSMGITTRFHWLSHKAISKIEIKVDYNRESVTNRMQSDKNISWIGPGSITEVVQFVVYLDVKHLIGIRKSEHCKLNSIMKNGTEKDKESFFMINIAESGSCDKCNFMCKWMKIKNDYLYKELEALQVYLNRSEANLFTTNILVKYEFNKNARRLKNSEYESIVEFIAKK